MDHSMLMTPQELRKWRHKNGYSQGTLARVLGVIPLTVSRWERGMREISPYLHLALKWLEKEGGELSKRQGSTMPARYPLQEEKIYISEKSFLGDMARLRKRKKKGGSKT